MTLDLTVEEINAVLQTLGNLPTSSGAWPLVCKIKEQAEAQIASAAKPTTNLWTIASDARVKTETGVYTKGLEAVCNLRPITYVYNGAAGFTLNGKENISIIAQEAIEHFPECVGTFKTKLHENDKEDTELFNWNGHALIFALVNSVKELRLINQNLAIRVEQLENR